MCELCHGSAMFCQLGNLDPFWDRSYTIVRLFVFVCATSSCVTLEWNLGVEGIPCRGAGVY